MKLLMVPLIFVSVYSNAQEQYADASLAIGNREGTLALSYFYNWQLGKNKKFEIGLAGRFTAYLGSTQYYITAPAELTSGDTGPLVIFTENIPENIDTFLVKNPHINAINLAINLSYRVNSKITLGFNIDAIGISFGKKVAGNYINAYQGQSETASPTEFNLLRISDNDLGTLNSELYGRYLLNEKWGIKLAIQFLFTEYTTDSQVQQLPEPNDRFRDKSLLFSTGFYYKLLR